MRQVLAWRTGQSCVGTSQIGPHRNQSGILGPFRGEGPGFHGAARLCQAGERYLSRPVPREADPGSFIPEAAPLYLAALIVAGRRAEIVCNLIASSNLQQSDSRTSAHFSFQCLNLQTLVSGRII